jgi:hypothetical protein
VIPRRTGLAAIVAGTAAYAAWLVPATGAHVPGWLVPAVIAAGAVGTVMVLDTPFEPVKLAQGIDDTMTAVTRVQTVTALRLEDADDGAPDLLATQTSAAAAGFIYATGREVLPIGGFTGTIPSPTLSQLQADIRAGRFRIVVVFSTSDPRMAWIAANCVPLARPTYDCAPPEAGSAPAGTPVRSPGRA